MEFSGGCYPNKIVIGFVKIHILIPQTVSMRYYMPHFAQFLGLFMQDKHNQVMKYMSEIPRQFRLLTDAHSQRHLTDNLAATPEPSNGQNI